jgi:exopolysaccharide biosynthesis polyprenyl glycosylphosphotransferase
MKRRDPSQILQALMDIFAICFAWQLAIRARTAVPTRLAIALDSDRIQLWTPSLTVILVLWLLSVIWLKLYSPPWTSSFPTTIRRSLEAALLLGCLTLTVTFFSRDIGSDISRLFVFVFVSIALLLFAIARATAPLASTYIDRRWAIGERIAIVGNSEAAARLLKNLQETRHGLHVCGLIIPGTGEVHTGVASSAVLGTVSRLAEHINRERLDRLILIERSISDSELEQCRSITRRMGIPVSCTVDYASMHERAEFSVQHGVPLVRLTPVSFSRRQELVKRALDIVLSLLTLVLLAPLMFAIAVLIKLTSPGPVLYKAPRVGKGGRHFTFLKFRSMQVTSDTARSELRNEKDGHIFKIRNDPRVTRLGKFLRRYSLDELPQLVNVLRGEMSFVGPRPLPAQDMDPDGMSRLFPGWAEQRSRVRPGITGLWQVRGRSSLAFEDMISFDLEYIQNWSLSADVRILLETPGFVLSGAGAY